MIGQRIGRYRILAPLGEGGMASVWKALDSVIYIQPRRAGTGPPQRVDASVRHARRLTGLADFDAYGLSGSRIGLLDTGVRRSHPMLEGARIRTWGDCVLGGPDCTGPNANPDDDCGGHGTCSAALLVGNDQFSAASRGLTTALLDTWKVYTLPAGGDCAEPGTQVDLDAVLVAFPNAVGKGDKIIVAEIQDYSEDWGPTALAADHAFDSGSVVVAADGDHPEHGTFGVAAPANARGAIGVGSFDIGSPPDEYTSHAPSSPGESKPRINDPEFENIGPTTDGRFKPDLLAPTGTLTASLSATGGLEAFESTSGATPYVAGAASILRDWMKGSSSSIDPGKVNAMLIACGMDAGPFQASRGAGPLRIPAAGRFWWGKVTVDHRDVRIVTLDLAAEPDARVIEVAIWWPEQSEVLADDQPRDTHNDIDLELLKPDGTVAVRSGTPDVVDPGVFERAGASIGNLRDQWKLRIKGDNVPYGPQVVYWAAVAKP